MICINCKKEIDESSKFCRFCGTKVMVEAESEKTKKNTDVRSITSDVYRIRELIKEKKSEKANMEALSNDEDVRNDELDKLVFHIDIKCPYCSSEAYHFEKKGFSAGKAIAGIALVGTVGAIGGTVGANRRIRVCDKCGKQF